MDKIEITVDNISEVRKAVYQANGSTEAVAAAKADNAAREFNSIPESGTIEKVDTEEYTMEIDGKPVIRTSIGVRLTSGKFISENQFSASTLTDELATVKSQKNKGKIMFVQERISPEYYDLGASSDLRLFALIGKSYTTEKVQGKTYKDFSVDKMFAPVGTSPSAAKNLLKNNVEPKTFYRFTFSETTE